MHYKIFRALDERVHRVQTRTATSLKWIVGKVLSVRPKHVLRALLTVGAGAGCLAVAEVIDAYETLVVDLSKVRDVIELDKLVDPYIYIDQNPANPFHPKKPELRCKGDIFQFITPWKYKNHYDCVTLIKFSQSPDLDTRQLAYEGIMNSSDWTDADYRMFSQALHHRTLGAIARSRDVDIRFFMPQPTLMPKTDPVENDMKDILMKMPLEIVNKCTHYATQTTIKKWGKEMGGFWAFEGNELHQEELLDISRIDSPVEAIFLSVLLIISKDPGQATKLVALGGLPILQRLYEEKYSNINVVRSIARIIANIAEEGAMHKDLYDTGWITILHHWLHNPDLAVFLYAVRGLANMDGDYRAIVIDNEEAETQRKTKIIFNDGIYLYHPWFRVRRPPKADVVFVHGLLGGPFRTWRQRDPDRPPLTEKELKQIHEWAENHDTERMAKFYSAVAHEEDISSCIKGLLLEPPTKIAKQAEEQRKTGVQIYLQRKDMPPPPQPEPLLLSKDPPPKRILSPGELENGPFLSMMQGEPAPEYSFCWPKDWLSYDCPLARLVTVEYDTQISEWAHDCPYDNDKTLSRRALEMIDKLKNAGIGQRPIIWIGHSMGGLMIKQMLQHCRTAPAYHHILHQTRGLVFFGVPHRGSPLASVGDKIKIPFFPSMEVQELVPESTGLLKLHEQFKHLMYVHGIPLLSFGEGMKTQLQFNVKILIVPEYSSDPGFGEFYRMIDANHLNICKPPCRNCPLYLLTLKFISDCIPELDWTALMEKYYAEYARDRLRLNDRESTIKNLNRTEENAIKIRERNDPGVLAVYDPDYEPQDNLPNDPHID